MVFRMALIDLIDATRTYLGEGDADPVCALKNVSLRVHSGEFVWITGSSGSGKSTLLNIIGCLDRPTAGRYYYAGTDLTDISTNDAAAIRRVAFGFVSQSYDLIEWATVIENVELPAAYAGEPSSSRRKRASEILGSLGVGDLGQRRPAELSGGERQRVAIARSLVYGGRVIIADEPTGALDTEQSGEILALLRALSRRGHTVIVASHDEATSAYATRRIELRDGRLAVDEEGEAASIEPQWKTSGEIEANRPRVAGWLIRTAILSLLRAPFRTTIAALSMVIGVACLIGVLSVAQGAYEGSRQAIGEMGADRISISELVGDHGRSRLTIDDAEAIESDVPNVRKAVAGLYRQASVQHGDRVVEAGLHAKSAISPPQFMYEEYSVESGAFLSETDDDDGSQVAVVGAGLRQQLFPTRSDPVGETIAIDGVPYVIKGVLAPHRVAEGPLYTLERATQLQTFVYVPYGSAVVDLFPPDTNPSIDVFVENPSRAEEAAGNIRDLLVRRHGSDGFGLMVHQRLLSSYTDIVEQNYLTLGGIGAVAMIVSGLGIAAAMLALVAQRRREIGIRMAVGARRKDIVGQFLAEATGTALVGAVMGTLAGCGVAHGLVGALEYPVTTAPWFLPAALGLALATGLASGLLPAMKAANLEPRLALSAN